MTKYTLINKVKTAAKALLVSLSMGGAALVLAPGTASAGAICNDGWISSSSGSGTCSWHGGVSSWTSPSSYSGSASSSYSNWTLPSLGSTNTYTLPKLNTYSNWSTPNTYRNWTLPSLGSTNTYRTGAICNDGWYSTATGSGACSWHGGVARWLP